MGVIETIRAKWYALYVRWRALVAPYETEREREERRQFNRELKKRLKKEKMERMEGCPIHFPRLGIYVTEWQIILAIVYIIIRGFLW